MTALKDNPVWVTGQAPNQTLVRRDAAGNVAAVRGAPKGTYPSIDLGVTRSGKLALTYLRCPSSGSCTALTDSLSGRRASYRRLAPRRCRVSSAPARWRGRVAYALRCDKLRGRPGVHDPRRSGLFVRKAGGADKRLRLPTGDDRSASFASNELLYWVDLRGDTVAAGGGDIARFVFSQTVNRSRLRATMYLYTPGVGIVTHDTNPDSTCR